MQGLFFTFFANFSQELISESQEDKNWFSSKIPTIVADILFNFYNFKRLSLSELLITETELKLMAAAAMIGDSSIP